jgi:hypothetical protein
VLPVLALRALASGSRAVHHYLLPSLSFRQGSEGELATDSPGSDTERSCHVDPNDGARAESADHDREHQPIHAAYQPDWVSGRDSTSMARLRFTIPLSIERLPRFGQGVRLAA